MIVRASGLRSVAGFVKLFGRFLSPVVAILAFAGCAGVSARHPSSGVELRITATDSGFEASDSVSGGLVHVTFENRGSTIHEVLLTKLPEGMDAESYLSEVRSGTSFPAGALDYSGPGLTSPGGRVEQWLYLDPGRYLLGCWFRGHLKTIPARILTVSSGPAREAELPVEDVVLRLVDFRFELKGQFVSGPQLVRVETDGPSLHEVDVFRLHDGKTLADLGAWRAGGNAGEAPADAVGGVLDSHKVPTVVWLQATFRPGRYVLWCGMEMAPDAPNSSTHADAGMVLEFEIAS